MGRRVTRKLKSESGVTLVLALVFFLICAVIGSVVIAAATSASGRMAGLVEQQQSYYTVSSAAEYFRDVTESRTVTLRQTGEKKDGMLEPKFGDPTLELSSEEEKSRVITAAVEGLLQSHGSSYQRNLTVHVDGSSFRDVRVRFSMDPDYTIRAVFTLKNGEYPSRLTWSARAVVNSSDSYGEETGKDGKSVLRTTTIRWEKGVITKG